MCMCAEAAARRQERGRRGVGALHYDSLISCADAHESSLAAEVALRAALQAALWLGQSASWCS